jgi:hypothetical protein
MLAIYNIPIYSFCFPLSNLFGIFRFELLVRTFSAPKLWRVKLKKINISDTFLFASSIEAPKLQRPAERTAHIVTDNEKRCLYVNFKQKKEWLSPDKQAKPCVKPDLHPHKTILCIWWGMEGIIHYELLETNLLSTTSPSG